MRDPWLVRVFVLVCTYLTSHDQVHEHDLHSVHCQACTT